MRGIIDNSSSVNATYKHVSSQSNLRKALFIESYLFTYHYVFNFILLAYMLIAISLLEAGG